MALDLNADEAFLFLPKPQDREKKLRNLKKKLSQIKKIKEKMANGEPVEKSQVTTSVKQTAVQGHCGCNVHPPPPPSLWGTKFEVWRKCGEWRI